MRNVYFCEVVFYGMGKLMFSLLLVVFFGDLFLNLYVYSVELEFLEINFFC